MKEFANEKGVRSLPNQDKNIGQEKSMQQREEFGIRGKNKFFEIGWIVQNCRIVGVNSGN